MNIMEILLLIIIVLLTVISFQLKKILVKYSFDPPLKFVRRKNSFMNIDVNALYYTDVHYPVYGREVIRITAEGFRHYSHSQFDLFFKYRHDSDKKGDYYIELVKQAICEKNFVSMMQANIDVLNGKFSIEEAKSKTDETIETNELVLPLASTQIQVDMENGEERDFEEYLDHDLLHDLERMRKKSKEV